MSFAAVAGAVAAPLVGSMFSDGGDGGGTPSAPDPEKTARAQGRENRYAALADALMARTNQYNPFYSITYENDPRSMAATLAASHKSRAPTTTATVTPSNEPEFLGVGAEGVMTPNPAFKGQQSASPSGEQMDPDQYNNPLNDADFTGAAAHAQVMRLDPAMLAAYNQKQAVMAEIGKGLFPGMDWNAFTANKFQNRPDPRTATKPAGELPDM